MVNVLISTDTRYPVNRKVIRSAILETFKEQKLQDLDLEVSVAVVGERKMKELSSKYLGDLEKHAVLAFALESATDEVVPQREENLGKGFVNPPDGVLRLGDVVLCWPELMETAAREDVLVDEELYLLTCHGVKHLLGYHHE